MYFEDIELGMTVDIAPALIEKENGKVTALRVIGGYPVAFF